MISAFLALAMAASPAGNPQSLDKNAPITVTGEREKPTCRRERSTGSVIPKVICLTAAQQKQQSEQAIRLKEIMMQRAESEEMIRLHNNGKPR